MKNRWTNKEINDLLNLVEEYKKQNKPLLDCFENHAKLYNRQTMSVRNFYYKKIDEILNDKKLQQTFSINIKLHQKNNFAHFDERQTKKLLDFVKKRLNEGKSVRSACLELANNDAKKLIRFQNKYSQVQKQNFEKNSKKSLSFAKKSQKNAKIHENLRENVISFPVEKKLIPSTLSDAEIQSLFLGLVKLVKKSAQAGLDEKIKQEQEKISLVIRKSTVEIGQKAEKIEFLLNENKKLSSEILSLKQKLQELRSNLVKI